MGQFSAQTNRVVDVMLQICGERPITAKTLALLKENGLASGHLIVGEIPGDDDPDDEEEEDDEQALASGS